MAQKNFYAVRVGRKPGIYRDWGDCKEQVDGFSCAEFKGFSTYKEAKEFMGDVTFRDPSPALRRGRAPSVSRGAFRKRSYTRKPDRDSVDDSEEELEEEDEEHLAILELCRVAALKAAQCVKATQVNKAPGAYLLHFDGGSRGNPGIAGSGAVITDIQTNNKLAEIVLPLPYGNTNNVAEYCGLIAGLMACVMIGVRAPQVKGDSLLVANQMNGTYKVNAEHLKPYHSAASKLLASLYKPCVEHIPREENDVADQLSNQAMDIAARQ